MDDAPGTLLIWADAERLELIRAVLERLGTLRPVGLGGPRRSVLVEAGQRWGVAVDDDLRRMLLEHPSRYLMLASATEPTASDWQQLRQRGTTVIALDPPSSLASVGGASEGGTGPLSLWVPPSLRSSPSWMKAAEPQEAVGAVRSLSLLSAGPEGDGSLYARLYQSMQLIVELIGLPESIDAAVAGPLTTPPDDLRGLTGHLTAHLRFAAAASAVVQVSDRCPSPLRQIHVVGAGGELLLDDTGYRLTGHDGRVLDSTTLSDAPPSAAELIAQQLRRAIEFGQPAGPATADPLTVIACCQAALLSCRTQQQEHPATLLRLR